MSTQSANRVALWVVAAMLGLLTAMMLTLAWWLVEDTPLAVGPSYAVTDAGGPAPSDRPVIVRAGQPLKVRHSYCVTGTQPGLLNQTLEDGVMVVLPSQPWVRREGCGEHTFVINLPTVLERGHVYLYRASVTFRVNPARPAETVWFRPVAFVVEG